MDERSFEIHRLHDLDSAVAVARQLQRDVARVQEIVSDALSVDRPHIACEKMSFLATLYAPKTIERIRELIALN